MVAILIITGSTIYSQTPCWDDLPIYTTSHWDSANSYNDWKWKFGSNAVLDNEYKFWVKNIDGNNDVSVVEKVNPFIGPSTTNNPNLSHFPKFRKFGLIG